MTSRHSQRQHLLAARQSLSAAQRMAAAETVATHLLQLAPWRADHSDNTDARHYLAGYWAVRGELPLHALVTLARDAFVYCLPCIEPGNRLSFAPWRSGDPLVANRFGIPEPDVAASSRLVPEDLDCVLLPLTGFDRVGNRLGSGAGYYDRSFAFRRDPSIGTPLLIGIAYDIQQVDGIEAADWDVALDYVVTETGVIDCRSERLAAAAPSGSD